jgi:poly-gamma-glutamate synthesis protein (capsule biosynthesis protein)
MFIQPKEGKHPWFWIVLVCGFAFLVVVIVSLSVYRNSQADEIPLEDVEVADETNSDTEEMREEFLIEELVEEDVSVPEIHKVRMIAVGDMMLDRSVYLHTLAAKDYNFPFARISEFLQSADLTVGNLEGAITDNVSIANGEGGNRFYFTFNPQFVEPLRVNFDVLSLANNHSLNFKEDGLQQSRDYLGNAHINYFGDPLNRVGNISTIVEKNGITFGFVGFHELVETGFENVVAEIKNLEDQVDFTIIYPHWGYEYVTTNPSNPQRSEARAMIDAGADMIIGAHPHVIQPLEIYKDKLIFYSLGNFIFDQYFSEETQQGLALDIAFTKVEDTIDFDVKLVPIRVSEKSQPYLATSPEREQILSAIAKYSQVSTSTQEMVLQGSISVE